MKGESAKESERAREGGSEREMFRNQVRERGTRTGGREEIERERRYVWCVCVNMCVEMMRGSCWCDVVVK